MTSPLDGFLDFCPYVQIPSRDAGMVPLWPLFGTQAYLHQEIERGLREGVHEFVILKGGRQIGGSTYLDALTLYYLQAHHGMVGTMVSNEDENRDYRRDLMLGMIEALPRSHKQPTRLNNRFQLAWLDNPVTGYRGSRLLFGAAGKRSGSDVGRSKGVNFRYCDEVGLWVDQRAYSALRASCSKAHPLRLYADISTAKGIGSVFHDAWRTAQRAVAQRAVFVAWWRHAGNTILPDGNAIQRALWAQYATKDLSRDEALRYEEVATRYGHEISRGQAAWYRWQLAEEFMGDETMMSQEYGSLPEECFQAFGDKFIPPHVIARLRRDAQSMPPVQGRRFVFAEHMEDMRAVPEDAATAPLVIYEEPVWDGFYIVGGHPWGSSGPSARSFVAQVWRAWPDKLRLAAEFRMEAMEMYQFAWVMMSLAGIYRGWAPCDVVLEIGGSGMHVMTEIERIQNLGYGLAPNGVSKREAFSNMLGAIRQYVYRRPDSFGNRPLKQMRANWQVRATLFYGLRDEVERGHVKIPSETLIDQLAGLRRGEEDGDVDRIGGGAGQDDSAAFTTALVTHMWLEQTRADLESVIAPSEPQPGQPRHVGEDLVNLWMTKMRQG